METKFLLSFDIDVPFNTADKRNKLRELLRKHLEVLLEKRFAIQPQIDFNSITSDDDRLSV